MEMLIELTEFDRPHRLGSRTASSMMQTTGTPTFAAERQDTVTSWDWQVRTKGWLRLLGLCPHPSRPHGAQDLDRTEVPARGQCKRSPRLTGRRCPHALHDRLSATSSLSRNTPYAAEPDVHPAGAAT
jgi:hypothetical protein